MTTAVNREEIANGVAFTEIIDKKIKTNVLKIKFITELSENDAALNTMAAMMIGSTNSKITTYSEMSDKLNSLYGSSLFTETIKSGDCQIITFSVDCIENRYAFENEDITGQLLDIAMDCIFSPNASDGSFDITEFNLKKREMLETIYAEINNKRSYAFSRAQKSIFVDEPCAFSLYGTKEIVEKITPKELYQAYLKLIDQSVVEIFWVSPKKDESIKERFAKAFSSRTRNPQKMYFRSVSKLKDKPCIVTEEVEMNQSKVVMAFKTSSNDKNACAVACKLFGGTTFSKLFSNVREKMSLCYYCSSTYVYSKGTMIADSGVENENVDKLTAEVSRQLDLLKNGNFTEDELMSTKLYITNSLRSVTDSPSSLIGWYFSGYCFDNNISPDEEINNIMNITREQVIEAAKSFTLDTVYVMKAKENTEDGDSDDNQSDN